MGDSGGARATDGRFPPRAYLIGAQKAGTTSLAALLARHPDIALSRPKEPDFFTGNWERGWAWYEACFAHATDETVLLDASTSYSMAPLEPTSSSRLDKVPGRIAACRPDARLIYVLRDPVDRAWSAYWHAVRAGWERDGFERAMRPDSLYIRASRYSRQLARYRQFFGADRILCVDFRDLKADIGRAAMRCLAFLGLPSIEMPSTVESHHNRSFVFTGFGNAFVGALGGPQGLKRLHQAFGSNLPPALRRLARSALTRDVPSPTAAQRQLLRRLLEEEYAALPRMDGARPR